MSTSGLAKKIYEQARLLPEDSLLDLEKYVEFLQYKSSQRKSNKLTSGVDELVKLDGILAGYDFSPDLLAEARWKLWQGFGDIALGA